MAKRTNTNNAAEFLALVREIGVTVDLFQASLKSPVVLNADAIIKAKASPVSRLIFLEALMRDFAVQQHQKARASGSPEDFIQAAEAYIAYLDPLSKSAKAPDMILNLAEAEYKGDRLGACGNSIRSTVA